MDSALRVVFVVVQSDLAAIWVHFKQRTRTVRKTLNDREDALAFFHDLAGPGAYGRGGLNYLFEWVEPTHSFPKSLNRRIRRHNRWQP